MPALGGSLAEYRHLVLDGQPVKWGEPVLGTGAVVTYALVDEAIRFKKTHFVDATNCTGMQPVDRLLASNGIERSVFDAELSAAFRSWSEAANLSFRRADPKSADILIGAETEPRGFAFTNLAFDATSSGDGAWRLATSVICLNPAKSWKVGFDGNLAVYDLRYTLMHEIGHAIGLDHPAVQSALMHFKYRESFRGLQQGDIVGVVELYGPSRLAAAEATTAGADASTSPAGGGQTLGLGSLPAE